MPDALQLVMGPTVPAQKGATLHMYGDRYFCYVCTTSDADWNASYLCSKCGRPVKYAKLGRFHCDSCDEIWFFEYKLTINTESGMWKGISREEFMKRYLARYAVPEWPMRPTHEGMPRWHCAPRQTPAAASCTLE